MFAIQVLIEVAVVLLIAYGVWHEDELIEIEAAIKQSIKEWK